MTANLHTLDVVETEAHRALRLRPGKHSVETNVSPGETDTVDLELGFKFLASITCVLDIGDHASIDKERVEYGPTPDSPSSSQGEREWVQGTFLALEGIDYAFEDAPFSVETTNQFGFASRTRLDFEDIADR
jgi:hypothetical protein